MQASGCLVVTSSSPNTQAEPGALREDPFRPRQCLSSHCLLSGSSTRIGHAHARTHLGAHPPAALARAHCLGARPLGRLRPRAAAPSRRHHGCQQLLPSAVQQPRPPAGPPRAGGTAPGRWPCSWLACTPGLSEDGRVAVPAASPSQ